MRICEDFGLCSPLLPSVSELKQRITIALETVTQDMLHCVWEELEYRLDMFQITGNVHIEHLQNLLWNSCAFKFLIQIYRNKSCFGQH